MSMARWGVNLKLRIGNTWLTREFVSTRLAGRNQLILGYSFLQETNPIINWTDGTLRLPDADTALQAIVQKRTVASEFISAKQMARILQKEEQKYRKKGGRITVDPWDSKPRV